MPIDEEQVDRLLQDEQQINEPAQIVGSKGNGVREYVPLFERRRRRATMETLLQNGASTDAIITTMAGPDPKKGGFGMTEAAVRKLMREVLRRWEEEDAEFAPYYRAMAIRRIQSHIRAAASDRKWGPAAQLEKVLADVQGTVSQEEPQLPGDQRELRGLEVLLADCTVEQRDEIIRKEFERYRRERTIIAVAQVRGDVRDDD